MAVLNRILARGGRVIWGIVDPIAPGAARDAALLLAETTAALGPLEQVAEGSLTSPACGTGRLSVATEQLVAAVLGAAGEDMRRAVGRSSLHQLP